MGWCAPQQGACKLTLNVKEGVIQEALVETLGCSGMTHSAAMASEILPGKTILEALNTDLVCDAINTAMRELFLQIVYGRTQSAFSEGGLMIGAGLEDLVGAFPGQRHLIMLAHPAAEVQERGIHIRHTGQILHPHRLAQQLRQIGFVALQIGVMKRIEGKHLIHIGPILGRLKGVGLEALLIMGKIKGNH